MVTKENQMLNDFWNYYRNLLGFDPNKEMTIEEKVFWEKVNLTRRKCMNTKNPKVAIHEAYSFDKQYFLAEWWSKLSTEEKKECLTHVWLNKGPSWLLGYDWWFPYFEEVGFMTNIEMARPTEKVELYRGSLPYFKYGMSWTDDIKSAQLFSIQHEGAKIYKAVVSPESILGVFLGYAGTFDGNERIPIVEFVVKYNEIEDIQEIS